jgi:hypothetical protein
VKRKFDKIALRDATLIIDNNGYHKIGVFSNKIPFEYKYLPELIDVYPLNSNVQPSIGMVIFKIS